jgi:hypothetical protein
LKPIIGQLDAVGQILNALNSRDQKMAITVDEDTMRTLKFLFKKPPDKIDHKVCFLKGIGMKKNNYAFYLVEDTMQLLIPSGIPQWTRKFMYDVLFREYMKDEDEPKVFSLNDFQFGFVIWSVACGISFIGFLMEIFYFYARKLILKCFVRYLIGKGLRAVK